MLIAGVDIKHLPIPVSPSFQDFGLELRELAKMTSQAYEASQYLYDIWLEMLLSDPQDIYESS